MNSFLTFCLMTIVLFGISADMQAQSSLEDRISSVLLHRGSEGEIYDVANKLREIGEPQQITAVLISMIKQSSQAEIGVRQSMLCLGATSALGELKEASAVDALTANLKDQKVDKTIRAYSARSLGKIEPQGSKNVLLEALADRSNYYLIRVFAAEGLAKTRDAEVLKILNTESGEEKDSFVRGQFEKSAKVLRDSLQGRQ